MAVGVQSQGCNEGDARPCWGDAVLHWVRVPGCSVGPWPGCARALPELWEWQRVGRRQVVQGAGGAGTQGFYALIQ